MSLARTHAVVSGFAWLAISACFVTVLLRLGVEAFASPAGGRARGLLAIVILLGFAINFAVLGRARRGRGTGEIDERDAAVDRRATEVTAVVVIVAVYLFGVTLYETHADAGTVPVGWLYILAYGTVVLACLVHPVVRLIVDLAGAVDA